MALASGNPVNTAMYWKLSASGAIRVGSSPTLFIIFFLSDRFRSGDDVLDGPEEWAGGGCGCVWTVGGRRK